MKIVVLGAGAFGTALAVHAARHPAQHAVTLWGRDGAQMACCMQERSNARYLPGVALPAALACSSAPLEQVLSAADLAILATPMAALRPMVAQLHALAPMLPVAWLCKGLEAGEAGWLAHEVQQQVAPGMRAATLSGPSFALELAQGRPTALVAASTDAALREQLVQALHGGSLRIYANDDVTGVEVGGAVKNVLAIATGLCDGLELGLNARAALITRGLAEMTRLGLALGAQPETFMGLSGLGDLVLTATGHLSRNRTVGMRLAQGQSLAQIIEQLGHVAEGVHCARAVVQRARQLGVEMPISECVLALLEGRITAPEAVVTLMGREPQSERH